MGHYITALIDARGELDASFLPSLNVGRLTELGEDAERRFDTRLSRRFLVPFTVGDNPEAYSIARRVCAKWAAAAYIRWAQQLEGGEDRLWYADRLDADAEAMVQLFETQRAPEDADPAARGPVLIPTDGKTAAVTTAFFSRDNTTPGSTHW